MPDRDRAAERNATEREIDALYQRPLAEFTAARNELARALAKSGARDESTRVKALVKPTVTPWAVNQVYWQARSIWDRLMQAGETLRTTQVAALERPGTTEAQVRQVRERVREATTAHREAINDAVHQAVRVASQSSTHLATDQVARMLESLSLAPQPPSPTGRFTEVIGPAGFEALANVTPGASPLAFLALAAGAGTQGNASPAGRMGQAGRAHGAGPAGQAGKAGKFDKTKKKTTDALKASELEDEEKAARQHALLVQAAGEALGRAQQVERQARTAEAQARDAVTDAELALTQARRALTDAERETRKAADQRQAAEAALEQVRQQR